MGSCASVQGEKEETSKKNGVTIPKSTSKPSSVSTPDSPTSKPTPIKDKPSEPNTSNGNEADNKEIKSEDAESGEIGTAKVPINQSQEKDIDRENNREQTEQDSNNADSNKNTTSATKETSNLSPEIVVTDMGSTVNEDGSKVITILHFNDVYNIEEREAEPVGGAARFVTAVKNMADINPLVLFSGDAFNPSLMSAVTKGKQMVPVLNACNVQCAVYGNHDFDFGVDTLVKLAKGSTFPWLMSNVVDNLNNNPLADGLTSHIIEWEGIKLGIVGLVEEEWIATLATIDPDDITFLDYVQEGRQLAKELRSKGADYIIALTHMRWPNDTHLAEEVDEIDLILGGHDHDYGVKEVNGKWVLKSGTDFREMSKLTLTFDKDMKADVKIEKLVIDSSIKEDEAIKEIVQENLKQMGEKMETILGHMSTDMDGRFDQIRKKETNLGNFITDIMLKVTDSDIALLNSGTLRSDTVHPRGQFKMKDLMAILPFVDPIVVIKISGEKVILALENSVCQYPKMEGRFAQVAGVSFGFDPTCPPYSRIYRESVKVQGEYIDLGKEYRLATKGYLLEGKDGYDVFKDCEVIVDAEEGPRLSTTVQNHFRAVRVVKGEKRPPKFGHRQSIVSMTRRKSLVRQLTLPETESPDMIVPSLSHPVMASPAARPSRKAMLQRRSSIESIELETAPDTLAPEVEGRIFIIDEHTKRELEDKKMAEAVSHTAIAEDDETLQTPTPKKTESFFG